MGDCERATLGQKHDVAGVQGSYRHIRPPLATGAAELIEDGPLAAC